MRPLRSRAAGFAFVAIAALAGCQQIDQALPFDLEMGSGRSVSVGPGGGLVSVLPSFAIAFPPGALATTTTITVAPRDSVFPRLAGAVVPGLAFDVAPRGEPLLAPARVQIAVSQELLQPGEDLRLAVGILRPTGQVVTRAASYDVTHGLLFADVTELGPMAAVVALDAIPVLDLAELAPLGGGSIAPPAPVGPSPAGPSGAPRFGGVEFTASCSGAGQNCYASGAVQLSVDDVVRARLGDDIVLLGGSVSASIEFFSFDRFGVPTQAIGFVEIGGQLRARLKGVVSGRRVEDELVFRTGLGATPSPTTVTFAGNEIVFAATAEGQNEELTFQVTGIGTGQRLTLRLERELEFENAGSLPPDVGRIVAHVRLRA